MIIGIGIDLVQSSRMGHAVQRWGERFLDRVFSPAERAAVQNTKGQEQSLSARFAIKEAVLKALGIGLRMGIKWREIETLHDPWGKPVVRLSGKAQEIATAQQVTQVWVSVSHEKAYTVAQVILTGEEG